MSKGQQMAISVLVPEAKIKDVFPVWKNYINNRSISERLGNLTTQVGNIFRSKENQVERNSLKVQKKGDEWFIKAIKEPNITSHLMDVYACATESEEGCLVSVFFQFTDSVFMNETNIDLERIQSLKSFIRDFGVEAYKSVVDGQIKEAKNELSNQEKVAKKMESTTRKAEKDISGYEVDIQEYEAGISDVKKDIDRLDESIEAKKLSFSQLTKNVPEYDVEKAELKNLNREKSKDFGKIKSLKNKVKGREMDIKKSKQKIAKNEQRIADQQKVIDEKEQIVDQLEKKKENIL